MRLGPRVLVGGITGSGKSTLARELARRLDAPHVEIDGHFHRQGWVAASDDEFRASVAAATAGERWVVDGDYTRVRDLIWPRLTTFVWLDYPRGLPTWRATRRTVRRLLSREVLWNGNRERMRNLFSHEHPIWWSWTQHPGRRNLYEGMASDPAYAHIEVVRLRSPKETRAWLDYAARP